jgi:hypothetical protein
MEHIIGTHDYYEYDGKLIDPNLSITQIRNLDSTKIFTGKNRLNGGGKFFDQLGIKNVHEMPIGMLNFMAEEFNDNVLEEYLKDNQDGTTSLEETESWD